MNKKLLVTALVLSGVCGINAVDTKAKAKAPQAKKITSLGEKEKIRFVDSFKVMRECKAGQEANDKLQKQREDLTKKIQSKEAEIKAEIADYQAKAPTLSEEKREGIEKSLVKKQRAYETMLQESEEELKLSMQKLTQRIAQDVEVAVKEIGASIDCDALVDTQTGRVLWVKPNVDVTAQVTKCVDKKSTKVAAGKKPAQTKKVA